MSEEILIKQCAPTLAGIKTGSLFTCTCDNREELHDQIRTLNRRYVSRGLCLVPLKYFEDKALLYMYRPDGLRSDLEDRLARKVLEEAGYTCTDAVCCVAMLARKMKSETCFPHEVGLFLSYPPEDVKGFIDNQAGNFKESGIWKVYGDVDHARKLFRKYHQCTDHYYRMWKTGMSMDSLVVKTKNKRKENSI